MNECLNVAVDVYLKFCPWAICLSCSRCWTRRIGRGASLRLVRK